MQRLKQMLRLVAPALLILGNAIETSADLYLVNVVGTIDSVDSALGGTFSVGQTLTSSYVFDSATPARAGSTSTFAVFDALTSLNFQIGTYSASTTGAPEIQVDNNPPSPNVDRYGVVARASDGLTGPSVAGNALTTFAFRLDDSSNSVFSTALVLPTNLSLSSFDNRRFFVFFGDFSAPRLVGGSIDGLTFTAVPEPGSLTLALTGLGTVVLGRLWRRGRS